MRTNQEREPEVSFKLVVDILVEMVIAYLTTAATTDQDTGGKAA